MESLSSLSLSPLSFFRRTHFSLYLQGIASLALVVTTVALAALGEIAFATTLLVISSASFVSFYYLRRFSLFSDVDQINEDTKEIVRDLSSKVESLTKQNREFSSENRQLAKAVNELKEVNRQGIKEATKLSSELEERTKELSEVSQSLERFSRLKKELLESLLSFSKETLTFCVEKVEMRQQVSLLQEKLRELENLEALLRESREAVTLARGQEDLLIRTLSSLEEGVHLLEKVYEEGQDELKRLSREVSLMREAASQMDVSLENFANEREKLLNIEKSIAEKLKQLEGLEELNHLLRSLKRK